MTAARRGRFITLEGGEGAGKSRQAQRLADRLASLGIDVVRTREPGGTPHAEELRQVILSGFAAGLGPAGEALLFAAARIDHLDERIAPALTRGAWVVCDRFMDSTRVYQGAAGALEPVFLRNLEEIVVGEHRPDLTLVLDIPAAEGMARARARRGTQAPDRFEAESVEFHETLRRAFLLVAAAEPRRCVVVDARLPEPEVGEAIWAAVEEHLQPVAVATAP
jgi:dTMP kinase